VETESAFIMLFRRPYALSLFCRSPEGPVFGGWILALQASHVSHLAYILEAGVAAPDPGRARSHSRPTDFSELCFSVRSG